MDSDTVRMTYAEAAAALGCKEKSVATRAKRRGWHREKGNDGRMRVHVPRDSLPDSGGDATPDSSPDSGPTVREAELMGEIKALQVNLKGAKDTIERLEVDKKAAIERETWLRAEIEARRPRRWWPW